MFKRLAEPRLRAPLPDSESGRFADVGEAHNTGLQGPAVDVPPARRCGERGAAVAQAGRGQGPPQPPGRRSHRVARGVRQSEARQRPLALRLPWVCPGRADLGPVPQNFPAGPPHHGQRHLGQCWQSAGQVLASAQVLLASTGVLASAGQDKR